MNSSIKTKLSDSRANKISFAGETLKVFLVDGQVLEVPTSLFPRLKFATQSERKRFQWLGKGTGIYWPDLDEDISIEGLLKGQGSQESAESVLAWVMSRKAKSSESEVTTIKILPEAAKSTGRGRALRVQKKREAHQ